MWRGTRIKIAMSQRLFIQPMLVLLLTMGSHIKQLLWIKHDKTRNPLWKLFDELVCYLKEHSRTSEHMWTPVIHLVSYSTQICVVGQLIYKHICLPSTHLQMDPSPPQNSIITFSSAVAASNIHSAEMSTVCLFEWANFWLVYCAHTGGCFYSKSTQRRNQCGQISTDQHFESCHKVNGK